MEEPSPSAPASPTIIVVDDDPAVRNALKFSLEVEGFAVRIYPGGRELLGDRDLPARGCLVVDQIMPGMTGLEVVAALRRRSVALPAVLVTTNPSGVLLQRAQQAGVTVVEKPLLTDKLLDCIRDALAREPQ